MLNSRACFRILSVALLAMLTVTLNLSVADAKPIMVWFHDSDDGKTHIVTKDDEADLWLYWRYNEDGYLEHLEVIPDAGNPNPEDGTTTPGDKETWKALLKQQGGTGYLTPTWQDTPLGTFLADQSIGPVHNPGEGDDEGGLSPSGISFKDPKDLANEVGGEGALGNPGGIDGNGGPIGGQIDNLLRKKGTNGSDDDDDNGAKPSDGGFWGEDMPGPPELVNPATAGALTASQLVEYGQILFELSKLEFLDN